LSQAVSALGDHSKDIFSTFKNLSTLVTALHDSTDLLEQLNQNLASVSSVLADDPNKVGQAAQDLNSVVGDVQSFTAANRDAIGTTSDKLTSITKVLVDSLDDIKQTLHIAPTTIQNFNNIYEPANGSLTGALAINNFANPISFLCGAIQSASRLGGEQAAKLCVQYLAPIVKDRRPDPMRSPTARIGCGRTSCHRPPMPRRPRRRPVRDHSPRTRRRVRRYPRKHRAPIRRGRRRSPPTPPQACPA
jgi:phospholipid/cholesterol/gamma-HCH transport system substrate-binding protein